MLTLSPQMLIEVPDLSKYGCAGCIVAGNLSLLPDFPTPVYPLPPQLMCSEPQGSLAPKQPLRNPACAPGYRRTYTFRGVTPASCLHVQKEVMYFQG